MELIFSTLRAVKDYRTLLAFLAAVVVILITYFIKHSRSSSSQQQTINARGENNKISVRQHHKKSHKEKGEENGV